MRFELPLENLAGRILTVLAALVVLALLVSGTRKTAIDRQMLR
jgi:hypothetical protein